MMHFPLFSKNVQTLWKFSRFYLFLQNLSIFIRQNFWWPFILPVSVHFPPLFRENFYFPPTFQNFPPTFQNVPSGLQKFTCFYILYVYFVSPYYDHDAFMHHPMHVVDASDAPYCVWVPVRLLMMPYVYDLNFGFVWSVGLRGILESVHSFSRTEA